MTLDEKVGFLAKKNLNFKASSLLQNSIEVFVLLSNTNQKVGILHKSRSIG
jgi:hypothetical protein